MIKEITMPAGGQTTDTSIVGSWLVKKGDKVKRGDALLEIETDKATLTVESFAKGTVLAILANEGDALPAGTVIAYIGEESDLPEVEAKLSEAGKPDIEESDVSRINVSVKKEEYQPIDKSVPVQYEKPRQSETISEDIKAMPNAKKMAKENHILLSDAAGYLGKNILKKCDVEEYIKAVKEKEILNTDDEKVPFSNMRRVIAVRMSESARTIPAFSASVEVNMKRIIGFRRLVNGEESSEKISYNDILFKCIEAAIRKYPYINGSYSEDAVILHRDVNIGLAVSVDNGLVVPVMRKVGEKNIRQIAKENKENIEKARDGKLSLEEMNGGTITLSNLGMYPVTEFQAIINPPEVCILAVGSIEEKPVMIDGEWKAVPVMKITGSFDHRVIDGAYGAGFLTELKRMIETPELALL